MFAGLVVHEASFEPTLKRTESLSQLADRGTPFVMHAADIAAATSSTQQKPILLPKGTRRLPAGAFAKEGGPS